jgi:hypothetical protein
MRRLAGITALLLALLPATALAQEDVNQGESEYVFVVDNPPISCADPTPGTKVEGAMGTTIIIITDRPIDYVTIKSGVHSTLVSATFYTLSIWATHFSGYGATITLTQDVSNYIPWTCPGGTPNDPLANDYQES